MAATVTAAEGRFAAGWRWARGHLFQTPVNSAISIAVLAVVAHVVWRLIDWGLLSATWSGGPAECRAGHGACWAFVGEKYRQILFGIYPYDQQWRPLLAMILFIGLLLVTAYPPMWRRALGLAWAVVLAVVAVLMWGGIAGLAPVAADRWGGLPLTLILSCFGIAFSFPLAVLLALGRRSTMPAIRAFSVIYIEVWRGMPLINVLFMASVMFPLFLPEGVNIDKLLRAQLGIILFTASYLAEIVRGGLQAIPRGQNEAALALGLGYWQRMRLVILPQALRLVIPPLVGQFITTFKDTSLVIIIGLYDLLSTTKLALADPPWRGFYVEGYVAAAIIYFVFTFSMSRYSQFIERRLAGRASRN